MMHNLTCYQRTAQKHLSYNTMLMPPAAWLPNFDTSVADIAEAINPCGTNGAQLRMGKPLPAGTCAFAVRLWIAEFTEAIWALSRIVPAVLSALRKHRASTDATRLRPSELRHNRSVT